MDEEKEESIISLKVKGGGEVQVKKSGAMASNFLKDFFEENETETEVTLPRVEAAVLPYVGKFLDHYAVDPLTKIDVPLEGKDLKDTVKQEWYVSFLDEMDSAMKFRLLDAANFMDIAPLLDLLCLWTAHEVSAHTSEEVSFRFSLRGTLDAFVSLLSTRSKSF